MPARKPQSISTRHSTKAEKDARESAEKAMAPTTRLTVTPPAILNGRKLATQTWKRLIGLYLEIEGEIITAFDADVVAKYCLLEDECVVMQNLRDGVLNQQQSIAKKMLKMNPKGGEEWKTFYGLMEQMNALLARYQGLDARLDGKRKLLHTLAQSMYLTPRSRAGVAPTTKPPAEEKDPTEELLGRSGKEG